MIRLITWGPTETVDTPNIPAAVIIVAYGGIRIIISDVDNNAARNVPSFLGAQDRARTVNKSAKSQIVQKSNRPKVKSSQSQIVPKSNRPKVKSSKSQIVQKSNSPKVNLSKSQIV